MCEATRSRPAFTLTELLVSLSIVAVLLAIILPALASARTTATSTVCLSRLASIMQGHAVISASNGGVWANLFFHDTEVAEVELGGNGYGLLSTLSQVNNWAGPFIGVLWSEGQPGEPIVCPAVYKRDMDLYDYVPMNGARVSYYYSAALITTDRLWDPADAAARVRPAEARHRKRVGVHEVLYPSKKVAMFETADHHGDESPVASATVQNVNAGFADGHIARVAPRQARPALPVVWPFLHEFPSPLPFSASEWGHRGYDF